MDKSIWHLRNCELFQTLSEGWIRRLESRSRMATFHAKSPIRLPEDSSNYLYLILNGMVRLSHITVDGKESILAFVGPGEVFGEGAVIDGSEVEEHVMSIEKTSIMMIPASEVTELLNENSGLAFSLTKLVGLRRHRIERRIKNLLFVSIRERLIHLLLDLAEQFGTQTENGVLLKIRLVHLDIANLIGITRESVTILLGQLRQEGKLEIERHKIIIKDIRGLAKSVNRTPVRTEIKQAFPFSLNPAIA
ncbi:Global nitrogen regulator [Gimesia panareensis]|uniref:Global nitrogen regulator n=1 Tax=Gimesia panareensis TaxID=2527978 RepID=A0A518FW69_9PLAN|nr:Crp/Fnr family transcriptional regulator [Gimesia panareensis]QDV20582.1 Global nitrogen regulator [Gimesia panareensis]